MKSVTLAEGFVWIQMELERQTWDRFDKALKGVGKVSEGNGDGIIKLGRHGLRSFQYDDDYPVKKLDVIVVSCQWAEIDRSFRDEKGEVAPYQTREYNAAVHEFAVKLLEAPDMSLTDAMHFIKCITEEVEKLKPFFALTTSEESSSRASSVTVGFSE